MVKRYPHTGVINWKSAPTLDNSTGSYTEGIGSSLTIEGRLEPAQPGARISDAGRLIEVNYKFFTDRIYTAVHDGETLTVLGQTRKILQRFDYQRNTEIWL
jgi:hypothetical protein